MKQNEQELQRFFQIREEIHKEIEKIQPNVLQLQEMTNRFVSHFNVFEKLSQNAHDQLKSTIKNASYEMAELTAEELSKKVKGKIQSILGSLEESVREANAALGNISKKNTLKTFIIVTLLVFLSLFVGFGLGGYYYEKRSHTLSKEFLKDLSIKKKPQEKRQR